jgi:hypothetical protein
MQSDPHLAATPPRRLRILFVVRPFQSHHSINLNCQLLLPDVDNYIFCRVQPERNWKFQLNFGGELQ